MITDHLPEEWFLPRKQ